MGNGDQEERTIEESVEDLFSPVLATMEEGEEENQEENQEEEQSTTEGNEGEKSEEEGEADELSGEDTDDGKADETSGEDRESEDGEPTPEEGEEGTGGELEPDATGTEDEKDNIIASLRSTLAEMSTEASSPDKVASQDEEEQEVSLEIAPIELKEIDFVGDANLEQFTKEDFNKILNTVRRASVDEGRRLGAEEGLRRMPKAVMNYVSRFNSLTKMVEAYYEVNEDLVPFKKVVGFKTNEVIKEQPEMPFEDALVDAGKRARKALGLKEMAEAREKTPPKEEPKKKKPAFVKPSGSRSSGKASEAMTVLQKDIQDLLG